MMRIKPDDKIMVSVTAEGVNFIRDATEKANIDYSLIGSQTRVPDIKFVRVGEDDYRAEMGLIEFMFFSHGLINETNWIEGVE